MKNTKAKADVTQKTASSRIRRLLSPKRVRAWVFLIGVLMLHVFDEAVTGFLPFYNQMVLSIREKWAFFPMPTFPSFELWLGGLIAALTIGLALTGKVSRGGRGIRIFVTIIGIIMISNALGHLLGSWYFGYPVPGFWSSFLLLPASIWVVFAGLSYEWKRNTA